jgi:hypothetical protein
VADIKKFEPMEGVCIFYDYSNHSFDKYTIVADSWVTNGLVITLFVTNSTTMFTIFYPTIIHAFVWKSFFPNDLTIAITTKKSKLYQRVQVVMVVEKHIYINVLMNL